jgi:hypothetical protein
MDASLMSNWLLAGSIAWSWPILGDVVEVSVLWVNRWVQAQTWQRRTASEQQSRTASTAEAATEEQRQPANQAENSCKDEHILD